MLAGQIGSRFDEAMALRLIGEIASERDEPFEDYFTKAITIFRDINCRFEHACTIARFGLALQRRNFSEADTYIEQARQELASIGAHGELRRLAR
jgi:hypothetical protein